MDILKNGLVVLWYARGCGKSTWRGVPRRAVTDVIDSRSTGWLAHVVNYEAQVLAVGPSDL